MTVDIESTEKRKTFSAHKSMISDRGEAEPDATVGVHYIRTGVFYFIFSMLPPKTEYYNRKTSLVGGCWFFFALTTVDGDYIQPSDDRYTDNDDH